MNYLKKKLKERNMSQSEFARRLGTTRGYICDIVHNRQDVKKMPIYKIVNMANILDTPLEEFIKEILKEVQ